MKYLHRFFIIFSVLFFNQTYAASGDSVMNAPSTTSTPSMNYQAATTSSGNTYSYTYVTQYQTSVCPSGLTANGSSIYNSAQRQIISTYLGSQLVSTQTTAWTDIDTDCVGYQYQTLSCPAGYNGTITQQQKIGTGVGGYTYGGWVTIANNCTPAYPAAGTVLSAGGYGVVFKGGVNIWVQAIATGDGGFYLYMTQPLQRQCVFDWQHYNSSNAAYVVDNSGLGLGARGSGYSIPGNC